MTKISFIIQQTPNDKWRLTQSMINGEDGRPMEQDRGVYDSPAKAEEAIKIILNPKRHFYDANGDEIK